MADAWTDAEKSSLLMQIIAQVKPEKGGINWDLVHIDGRTNKACQNTWGKFIAIHKAQQEGLGGDNGEGSTPPKPKRTPVARKRKSKKEQEKADDSDSDNGATPTKKPRDRPRKAKIEEDIDVPQPETLEEAKQLMASEEDAKLKREECI